MMGLTQEEVIENVENQENNPVKIRKDVTLKNTVNKYKYPFKI